MLNKIYSIETPKNNPNTIILKKENLNISRQTKNNHSNFLKIKKYIKINEISKYKIINNKINKEKIGISDEEKQQIGNDTKRSIQKKLINIEKNSMMSFRKMNYRMKLNNITSNDKKDINKIKEKDNNIYSFSERTLNNNTRLKEDKCKMNLFSARISRKISKSKKIDPLHNTPQKKEDKIKILPTRLLKNISVELNSLKNNEIK